MIAAGISWIGPRPGLMRTGQQGRDMRLIHSEADLPVALAAACREALGAFASDEINFEKLLQRARHVEVKILGDRHSNVVHLLERECTGQRCNQQVERAPAPTWTRPSARRYAIAPFA